MQDDNYYINPIQLALRFVLEVLAIIAYAVWGWSMGPGIMSYINALMIPGFIMMIWGVFNVPGDKSRSGTAVVAVKGWVRLLLEAAVFVGAGYAMIATEKDGLAIIFLSVTIIHYAATHHRIKWLLTQ